jgi:hypothetical protein
MAGIPQGLAANSKTTRLPALYIAALARSAPDAGNRLWLDAIRFETPMVITPLQWARVGLAALIGWEIALHAILWAILAERPPSTDDNPTLIVSYVALVFALPATLWALARFLLRSRHAWPIETRGMAEEDQG